MNDSVPKDETPVDPDSEGETSDSCSDCDEDAKVDSDYADALQAMTISASNADTACDDDECDDCEDCAICKDDTESDVVPSEGMLGDMAKKAKDKFKKMTGQKGGDEEPKPDSSAYRFQVGDQVEAMVHPGKWASGVISQHNYTEPGVRAPYQILLDSGSYVYAPADHSDLVRKSTLVNSVQQSSAGPAYRFKVGDVVEAYVEDGGWQKGKIHATDYTEPTFTDGKVVPYQIQLDNGTLVYAEDDGADLVRSCACSTAAAVQQSAAGPFTMARIGSRYRFRRGDRVLANVGTWMPGTVIKTDYREPTFAPGKTAPYQILLDNNVKVYAENDSSQEVMPIQGYVAPSNGMISDLAKKAKDKINKMAGSKQEKPDPSTVSESATKTYPYTREMEEFEQKLMDFSDDIHEVEKIPKSAQIEGVLPNIRRWMRAHGRAISIDDFKSMPSYSFDAKEPTVNASLFSGNSKNLRQEHLDLLLKIQPMFADLKNGDVGLRQEREPMQMIAPSHSGMFCDQRGMCYDPNALPRPATPHSNYVYVSPGPAPGHLPPVMAPLPAQPPPVTYMPNAVTHAPTQPPGPYPPNMGQAPLGARPGMSYLYTM